ncbi:hypothetical protein DPQ22_02985 [Candidatus Tokpelaia sp.]|nr:hypothetical protein DPQ22_02985 [Candidatus Tokpelaia sp.]
MSSSYYAAFMAFLRNSYIYAYIFVFYAGRGGQTAQPYIPALHRAGGAVFTRQPNSHNKNTVK